MAKRSQDIEQKRQMFYDLLKKFQYNHNTWQVWQDLDFIYVWILNEIIIL